MHVRKYSKASERKKYVSTCIIKPGNLCFTDCHYMTIAVAMALNSNTK